MRPRHTFYPDEPLSAHELLRAHSLVQRLTDALAPHSARRFKNDRHLLLMLPRWIWSQREYPHARQWLRHHLAHPPKILGEAP